MLALLVAIFYIALKYAAYAAWCYYGLKKFRPGDTDHRHRAYVYGLDRLLIGFSFGILVFVVVGAAADWSNASAARAYLAYFGIYVPVRWVEWSLMSIIINSGSNSPIGWLLGINRGDRLWRLGGIAISCLADAFLIAMMNWIPPVGRILC